LNRIESDAFSSISGKGRRNSGNRLRLL
jgi:hypothetical protein